MSNKYVKTIDDFALLCYKLLKSDRENNIAISGTCGEGKSCLLTKIFMSYSKISKVYWDFDLMTWSRNEFIEWIDGKKGTPFNDNGLRENQLPEFTPIGLDELFLLFYKRNWYEEGQIDSIGTLNMCRDRHLLIGGNVPNFWDLDGAFTTRIRFYIYVVTRGVAWVFEQDQNPFNVDVWNKTLNKKMYMKYKNPYGLPNFLMELHYNDWTPKEKIRYYKIRNKKRLMAVDVNKDEKKERYTDIKRQRDILIKLIYEINQDIIKNKKVSLAMGIDKFTYKDIAEVLGISQSAIKLIMIGRR